MSAAAVHEGTVVGNGWLMDVSTNGEFDLLDKGDSALVRFGEGLATQLRQPILCY